MAAESRHMNLTLMQQAAFRIEGNRIGQSHLFPAETSFPLPDIARRLGDGNGTSLGNKTLKKIELWRERLKRLVQPRLVYSVWPTIENGRSGIETIDGIHLESRKLAFSLAGCPSLICFAATLGDALEAEVGKLNRRKRYSDAFIVDALGSVGAEQVVGHFHTHMERRLTAAGRGVTLRFSPGYCDWNLEEQRKLFSLVDAGRIGVALNDSELMIPRKSISGVFGVTDFPSSPDRCRNPCVACGRRDCEARRLPDNPLDDLE